jgi:hypothetical protein
MGSGKVFPVVESTITVPAFDVPRHWPRINGVDFGWDHPFAAISMAWDRDADTTYVTAAYRQKEAVPAIHVAAIRPWGDWIPCAWPHDGLQHDKGSGEQLASQYRAAGLTMLHERSTHPEGGNGVEAGIMDMLQAMHAGQFKVFSHLHEWFEEFRLYHRKDGKLVKLRDDLMSATRYARMMRRFAIVKPDAMTFDYSSNSGGSREGSGWMMG